MTGPMWDLVVQLRFLLDAEGKTVEELVEDRRAPCGPSTLRRVMTGQVLPAPDLLKWIARQCGGDPSELQGLYQRAREAEGDARRAAARVRRAGVPAGRVRGPVGRAVRQAEQRAAEEEFWGPIGEARNWSDRMFRRRSGDDYDDVEQFEEYDELEESDRYDTYDEYAEYAEYAEYDDYEDDLPDPPRRRGGSRRPRAVRRPRRTPPRRKAPRRPPAPRRAEPEDLEEGPLTSRIRPTLVAVVLLASFAVGIILATVAIGGQA